MASLKQIEQTHPGIVERIRDAASYIYNACGHDIWGNDTIPSDAEFVHVLIDQIAQRQGEAHEPGALSADDYAAWHTMSHRARREVLLAVGP